MPKLAEYFFVYDDSDGTFPERRRVLREGDDPDDIHDADELTGTVAKAEVDGLRAEMNEKYPSPRYRVATSWANRWGAVARNYRGLDYEYD